MKNDLPCNLPKMLSSFEVFMIKKALIRYNNNRAHAAAALGIGRTCLVEKMRKYELLDDPEWRSHHNDAVPA